MIFSSGFFLMLLPLAGLPIVFHFLLKQKKRYVQFPTLMFFHKTDPKMTARHKLRQLLVLLMRMLVLAFLLLALSRPSFNLGGTSKSGVTSMVVVIDNSASMLRIEQGGHITCLDMAKDAAGKLLGTIDKGSFGLRTVVVDPSISKLPDTIVTDRNLILEAIDQVLPTYSQGDLLKAVRESIDLLETGGTIHIFTDLQRHQFEYAGTIGGAKDVSIQVHKIMPQDQNGANVAIRSISYPPEMILPGHPATVNINLENTSDYDGNVTLVLDDGTGSVESRDVDMQQGSSRMVTMQLPPGESGFRSWSAHIEGDSFNADGYGMAVVSCGSPANVVFAGSPNEYGLLPLAVSPLGDASFTGIGTTFRAVGRVYEYVNESKPEMLVLTWQSVTALDKTNPGWLESYVNDGGNLVAVPAVSERGSEVVLPDFMGAEVQQRFAESQGRRLEVMDRKSEFWYKVFGSRQINVEDMTIWQGYKLKLTSGTETLLGAGYKDIVMSRRKVGKGNVYVLGMAFDTRWSSLPKQPLSVVMAQNMVVVKPDDSSNLDALDKHVIHLAAGQELPVNIFAGNIHALSIAGDTVDYTGDYLGFVSPVRPAVLLIDCDKGRYAVAFSSDSDEGRFDYMPDGTTSIELFGGIAHSIATIDQYTDYSKLAFLRTARFDLFVPLLILAMMAFAAETLLANPRIFVPAE